MTEKNYNETFDYTRKVNSLVKTITLNSKYSNHNILVFKRDNSTLKDAISNLREERYLHEKIIKNDLKLNLIEPHISLLGEDFEPFMKSANSFNMLVIELFDRVDFKKYTLLCNVKYIMDEIKKVISVLKNIDNYANTSVLFVKSKKTIKNLNSHKTLNKSVEILLNKITKHTKKAEVLSCDASTKEGTSIEILALLNKLEQKNIVSESLSSFEFTEDNIGDFIRNQERKNIPFETIVDGMPLTTENMRKKLHDCENNYTLQNKKSR